MSFDNDDGHAHKKPKLDLKDSQSSDDGCFDCIICCEQWEPKGPHRLVSLKCGHLFGRKCIERWIENKTQKSGAKAGCPVCVKPAYEKNICIVKPYKIAVKDTTQSELMKRELESLRGQIKMAEKEVDLAQLSLNLHKKEVERAKERKHTSVQVNKEVHIPDTHTSTVDTPPVKHKQLDRYTIVASKKLSEQRHISRVMAMDQTSTTAYISFKSSDTTHDILKLDLTHLDQSKAIRVHTGLIKDIQYNDNLILSTSMDRTLKLTSSTTNKVEQTMTLPLPGWSCSFNNSLDTTKVYCGLGNSDILIYDTRYPSQIFQKLESSQVQKSPMHSLFHDNKQRLFCSNLSHSFVWNTTDTSNCTILETNITKDYKPYSMSFVEGSDNTVLLSSRNINSTKHQYIELDENCQVISTFDSPLAQKSLTRTFSFVDDTMVLCYSDEPNGMLRFVKENESLQHFRIQSCPLDIKLYSGKKPAFLTDNRLFLLDPKYKDV